MLRTQEKYTHLKLIAKEFYQIIFPSPVVASRQFVQELTSSRLFSSRSTNRENYSEIPNTN